MAPRGELLFLSHTGGPGENPGISKGDGQNRACISTSVHLREADAGDESWGRNRMADRRTRRLPASTPWSHETKEGSLSPDVSPSSASVTDLGTRDPLPQGRVLRAGLWLLPNPVLWRKVAHTASTSASSAARPHSVLVTLVVSKGPPQTSGWSGDRGQSLRAGGREWLASGLGWRHTARHGSFSPVTCQSGERPHHVPVTGAAQQGGGWLSGTV